MVTLSRGLRSARTANVCRTILYSQISSITMSPSAIFPTPCRRLVTVNRDRDTSARHFYRLLRIRQRPVFTCSGPRVPILILGNDCSPIAPRHCNRAITHGFRGTCICAFPNINRNSVITPPNAPTTAYIRTVTLSFLTSPARAPRDDYLTRIAPEFRCR